GTYSWNDSRVKFSTFGLDHPGKSFLRAPSHTANVNATYAYGGTSLTLVANYVGTTLQPLASEDIVYEEMYKRIKTYLPLEGVPRIMWSSPGYVKSNLSASHRLSPSVSATLHVNNLGNSYGSEVGFINPTLGRQTSLGVSLRFPQQ